MRLTLIILACLAITACGFQLRGNIELPSELQSIYIEVADTYSPLKRDLSQALKRAGAKVLSEPDADSGAIIKITRNEVTTAPLTISEAARVNEFRVLYRVDLEIINAAGEPLLAKTELSLDRDYSYDETQALGAAAEEQLIREELQKEMVQYILRRIETLSH